MVALMPQVGDHDGHGRYGVVDENADGLLCHECGLRFTHLGLHAWKRHGMPADTYRQAHGLGHRGLVAAATRARIVANARDSLPNKRTFLARRDPARARAIQLELGQGLSPAGTEAVREALRGRTRRAIIIECKQCGALFCPLRGGRRRRFCSRSCSSRFNRAAARHRRTLSS